MTPRKVHLATGLTVPGHNSGPAALKGAHSSLLHFTHGALLKFYIFSLADRNALFPFYLSPFTLPYFIAHNILFMLQCYTQSCVNKGVEYGLWNVSLGCFIMCEGSVVCT